MLTKYSLIIFEMYCIMKIQNVPDKKVVLLEFPEREGTGI